MSEFWKREKEICARLGGPSMEFASGSNDPDVAAFIAYLEGGEYRPQFAKFMPKERDAPDAPRSTETWPDDYGHQAEGKPPIRLAERISWILGGL